MRAAEWDTYPYCGDIFKLACLIERSHNIRPEFQDRDAFVRTYTADAYDEYINAPVQAQILLMTIYKRVTGWKSSRDLILERLKADLTQ